MPTWIIRWKFENFLHTSRAWTEPTPLSRRPCLLLAWAKLPNELVGKHLLCMVIYAQRLAIPEPNSMVTCLTKPWPDSWTYISRKKLVSFTIHVGTWIQVLYKWLSNYWKIFWEASQWSQHNFQVGNAWTLLLFYSICMHYSEMYMQGDT